MIADAMSSASPPSRLPLPSSPAAVGAATLSPRPRRRPMTSLTDPLTSLPGRRRLEQRLATLCSDFAPRTLGLLAIDLDRFEAVNDRLGRDGGDDLLRAIGPRLRTAMAGEHLVVRVCGDEFAVLVEKDASSDRLAALAARVDAAFAEPFSAAGEEVAVSVTIGGALLDSDDGVWADLLHDAEQATRTAKRRGAGYLLHRAHAEDEGRELLDRVEELRGAIPGGELTVHWQPQVDLADGTVRAAEALVRWDHPALGLLAPHEFLLLAEAADLLGPLLDEMLRQALAQAAAWREELGRDVAVAVNLGLPDVLDDALPARVAGALAEAGVPPRLLTLELTERAVMQDPRRALAVLFELRALGVRLALDDFGIGAASLTCLARLPLDELKVDRALVARLRGDRRDAAVVRAVVRLGRDLDLRVVAEGVEDDALAVDAAALGCDALQGFHLCRPQPAAGLGRWLRARERGGGVGA